MFDLSGDGRTVLKGNYGFFWHNPGVGIGSSANPNTPAKQATYQWNDTNGDRRWQPGEQGNLLSQALEGGVELAADIDQPYSHEGSVWLERQLADTLGMRAGFVYKTEDDLIDTSYQPFRGLDAYTVPFTYVDIGVDGRSGTSDDRNLTFYGIPTATFNTLNRANQQMNVDQFSRYKTIEASVNRRYADKWSASFGGAYTMQHDFATGARGLLLQLLEASDDLQGIRATVSDIAELDEGRFSARPAAVRADQAGRPRDRRPGGIIAVQVADGDDAARRGLG